MLLFLYCILTMGIGSKNIQRLFAEEIDETDESNERPERTLERSQCIAHRAYFYLHIRKLNYEYTLEILSREFFWSELTIGRIINSQLGTIRGLLNQKADEAVLAEKYPQFNWKEA